MKTIRVMCVLLSVFVACGTLFAAGGDEATATPEELSFSYWVPVDSREVELIQDRNDNHVFKELEKQTGVKIEFIHPAVGQHNEAYNLMIASGDLPDIIEHQNDLKYPGGWDEAIDVGDFLRLNELVEEHAPNYWRIINSDFMMLKMNKTDTGNLYGFQMLETDIQPSYYGPVVRKDWLDDLNMQVPVTVDDWYEMLVAFKEEKGAEYPLGMARRGFGTVGEFTGAYGTYHDLFLVDGKVQYGPMMPGWKDYLSTMNQWLKEELFDSEFVSWDDNKMNYLKDGKTGAWSEGFWMFVTLETRIGDQNLHIVPTPLPVLKEGDQTHVRQTNYKMRGYPGVITSECDFPEKAVEWMDYRYSDESYMLFNYGIEGESYNLVDGKVVFTDLIMKNDQGLDVEEARRMYQQHHGPYVRDWRAIVQQFTPREIGAHDVWGNGPDDGIIPPLQFTPDEASDRADIMNDVKTYMEQMAIKFIRGDEPLSNFDKYVDTIKGMNIDKAIEITQNAYNRFVAR